MICNITYFGQVMTLTWGQLLNLTFRGYIIYHSMRLDEQLRTMVCELFLYLFGKKSYCRKSISGKFAILIWYYMTSIGWTADLRSNLRTAYQKSVSTAIECFFSNFLAHLVPEIKREIWRDVEIAKKSQHFEFGDLCWPRFWPDPKMIWVFLVDLISTYPTPFTACRYVAPFSRSQGGGVFSTPPAVRVRLRPAAVRVLNWSECKININ